MRSTDSLLLLELPKIRREIFQQVTPSAVFCAERSPDQTTMVFRSWLGTCPCQCRLVHSARCPNDAPPSIPPAVSSGRQRSGCRQAPEAADHRSALVPAQDPLDHVGLWQFDKSHHRHLAPHCGHDNGSTSYTRRYRGNGLEQASVMTRQPIRAAGRSPLGASDQSPVRCGGVHVRRSKWLLINCLCTPDLRSSLRSVDFTDSRYSDVVARSGLTDLRQLVRVT